MTPEHAAELMTLLLARTASWEQSASAFNALRQSDVAQAMAMVKNIYARLLLRIKYADEQRFLPELERNFLDALERGLFGHAVELAAPAKWKIPRKDFLRDMCRLALAECISPYQCPRCGGRGTVMMRRVLAKICPRCEGARQIGISDVQRARLMRVSDSAWRHNWRDRYLAILEMVQSFEAIGKQVIAKRLR